MTQDDFSRRQLLQNLGMGGAALSIGGITLLGADDDKKKKGDKKDDKKGSEEPEVTATEDLMREHGVIRRALLIYHETVPMLRASAASVDAASLYKTAQLFRRFGEDYHEHMLEETYIFPAVRKLGGRAGKYPDVLEAQHKRGREITDFMMAVTKSGKVASNNAEPLAKAMEGLVEMYEHHAAREDTIVFPAWKTTMSAKQLDEISDRFEDIEHKEFGKDGFEDAEKTVDGIEMKLGFSDISRFTPPPPPKL